MKISTQDYINNQVTWLKDRQDIQFRAVQEAVNKSEAMNIQKFEAQNEWRAQMKDQTAAFVTRRELWGAVLAIVAMLISVSAIMLTRK